jgi:hypothetical protein
VSTLATIIVSVSGSSVLSAIIAGLLTFSVNRASAAKARAEAEKIATEKASLAQKTVLELFETTNKVLESRCGRCETQLAKVEDVVQNLIEAIETFVDDPAIRAVLDTAEPQARLTLRASIWAARQAV